MKVLLVGAGGYGFGYVKELLSGAHPDVVFEGAVEPYYETCRSKELLDAAQIPVYDTMEAFYAEHEADLAVIATPPFLHCAHTLTALEHGSYVLCEKPLAATKEDALRMREAEQRFGRWVAIGYQWSFSEPIRALKQDILDGVLGAPVSMKTLICWPRGREYYTRGSGWGGRLQKDGVTVRDSIASNACAHYLHNMLFLLGEDMASSAAVESLEGVYLRANEIETFDTCSLQMRAAGVPLYFVASHATDRFRDPEFVYRFEKATLSFAGDVGKRGDIVATFADGSTKCYGDPFTNELEKLWYCVDALRNGTLPFCTVHTAMPQTMLIERLHQNCRVEEFDPALLREGNARGGVYAEGLFEAIDRAYREERLLDPATL